MIEMEKFAKIDGGTQTCNSNYQSKKCMVDRK